MKVLYYVLDVLFHVLLGLKPKGFSSGPKTKRAVFNQRGAYFLKPHEIMLLSLFKKRKQLRNMKYHKIYFVEFTRVPEEKRKRIKSSLFFQQV